MLFFLFVSQCFIPLPSDCVTMAVVASLVPAEVNLARAVGSLFDQGLVKLSSGAGVDVGPAEFAVVLQTGDVGAEEGSKFPSTACTLTLVAQLIIQDVGLHLHLHNTRGKCIDTYSETTNVCDHKRLEAADSWTEANSISLNELSPWQQAAAVILMMTESYKLYEEKGNLGIVNEADEAVPACQCLRAAAGRISH